MLRSKSFHKSSPCLRPEPIVGRDELEERYLDLRDQHQELRREARAAQDQIRLLNVRLSRLIEEKKRLHRNYKTEREIMLEEQIFDLRQQLVKKTKQNDQLRDRIQLIRIQNQDFVRGAGVNGQNVSTPVTHVRHQQMFQSTFSAVLKHNDHTAQPNRHSSSAYAHVQSRTDSGLGVYFRPLNIASRSKSQLDLRPKTSGSVRFSDVVPKGAPSEPPGDCDTGDDTLPDTTILPFTATQLLQEAKQEIVRLETIVEQQKSIIDSLVSDHRTSDVIDTQQLGGTVFATDRRSSSTTANQISYTITTTTTESNGYSNNSLVSKSKHPSPLNDSMLNNNEPIDHLWDKYRQIVLHKESTQQISADIQTLIERIYRSLNEEKQKVAQLQAKLQAKQDMSSVINEKDKQIETLRKENNLLQNSLSRCVDQCMDTFNTGNGSDTTVPGTVSERHLERIKTVWSNRKQAYETEIEQLTQKITALNEVNQGQQQKSEQLKLKFDNLQKLYDNDQLHIKHLEEKVSRLTAIVFTEKKYSQIEMNQRIDGDGDADNSNVNSVLDSSELDDILNSLPPYERNFQS